MISLMIRKLLNLKFDMNLMMKIYIVTFIVINQLVSNDYDDILNADISQVDIKDATESLNIIRLLEQT